MQRSGACSRRSELRLACGRKVQVYAVYTRTRDVTRRLQRLLTAEGIRAEVLTAEVPPEQRESWYERHLKAGMQVCICHPKLVQTGLDLLEFPTLIFAQTGYSIYVLRQASRRSWRIGQRRPVKVKYLHYANSMQESCLRLMGKKLLVSLAMEGKFASHGLQALEDDDDMLTAMARELVTQKGVGERADAVWKTLQAERASAALPPSVIEAEAEPVIATLEEMPSLTTPLIAPRKRRRARRATVARILIEGRSPAVENKGFYVNALPPSGEVTLLAALTEKELRPKRSGGLFLHLKLADRTGEIDGKAWDQPEELARTVDCNAVVKVRGTIETYNDKPQLVVSRIRNCRSDEYEAKDFYPASARDPDEMYGQLLAYIELINDAVYSRSAQGHRYRRGDRSQAEDRPGGAEDTSRLAERTPRTHRVDVRIRRVAQR